MEDLIQIDPADNVGILQRDVAAGEKVRLGAQEFTFRQKRSLGDKIALREISAGQKYGAPIGSATQDIAPGDHVHLHNMKSDYIQTVSFEKESSTWLRS